MQQLTGKQKAFVQEYAIDSNGFRAAVAVGYAPISAKVSASRNITKDNVAHALREHREEYARGVKIKKDRLVDEWAVIAFSNMKGLFTVDANGHMCIKMLEDIDDALWPAIQEIKTFNLPDGGGMGFQLKLYNKTVALRNLGEMRGDYIDPVIDLPRQGNITININAVSANGHND